MLTERQEKILSALIREYICQAEPVSSKLLQKSADLDVSSATIRNDFQELTEAGYIYQPHTSAGRVPTQKAYQYFADKFSMEDYIVRQIEFAHREMERQMREMGQLMQALENDNLFDILNILDIWHKKTRN